MSGLLYTLLGLAASSNLHCAVRREISPCTCRQQEFPISIPATIINTENGNGGTHTYNEKIEVVCERMTSFNQIAEALSGKFTVEQQITLRVSHSQVRDISKNGFKDFRMTITRLELTNDHLNYIDGDAFVGLHRTQFLSLADNDIPSIPRQILVHLNLLRTLDLSRNKISRIDPEDFKHNPTLQHLSMAGNGISEIMAGSLPPLIKHLHVGRNQLKSLNHTLRDLNQLEWLLINSNELTTLDGELPASGHNLKMLYAADNKLSHLPHDFRYLHRLESLFLQHNKIKSLDGTLQNARRLKFLELSYNSIQELTEDDFSEAELLEDLQVGHNSLRSLTGSINGNAFNSALYPLKALKCLNLTHNELTEFSFSSLRGLHELRLLDLSNNKIRLLQRHSNKLPTENLIEEEGNEVAGASIQDMRLESNQLRSLEGSLFNGMKDLQKLNLSHNLLGPRMGLGDLRGLDNLRILDLSYNELITLENTSETWLPVLEELHATHNQFTTLSERDFRGFPGLCWVDVSSNQITAVVPEVVANTRCTIHGVPDILRIYLEDNPVLCDPGLIDLTVALEVNHAKAYGVATNCPTTASTPVEQTSLVPLSPTLLFAAAAAASGGNISFAATF